MGSFFSFLSLAIAQEMLWTRVNFDPSSKKICILAFRIENTNFAKIYGVLKFLGFLVLNQDRQAMHTL